MFDDFLKGLKDHEGLEYSNWEKWKQNLIKFSIVFTLFILGFTISDLFYDKNSKTSVVKTEKVEKNESFNIPKELINKTLYTNPYLCRNTLSINENYEFERVIHSIGNLSTSERMIIKGKILPNGKIQFYTNNKWYFKGDIKEQYMNDVWDLETRYLGIIMSDYSYKNTGDRITTGYSSTKKTYSINECDSGY